MDAFICMQFYIVLLEFSAAGIELRKEFILFFFFIQVNKRCGKSRVIHIDIEMI